MEGKPKYNQERYIQRRTYSGRELKQIIGQMKIIENNIPKQWNQMQKAKYIYEVLGKNIEYDLDAQKPSSLSVILERKGVCAGYALLYKEMMDRQGIQCDYMRGIGLSPDKTESEKHAWNVLTIDGKSFPIDLTWDSPVLRRGETQLQYFGNNPRFFDRHITDSDERQYNYQVLSTDFVNSINTDPKVKQSNLNQDDKMSIIKLAIEQTYTKHQKQYGSEDARIQVSEAIKRYITTGLLDGFTRQGQARAQLEEHITPTEMLELVAKSFVTQNYNGYNQNARGRILENSVNQTSQAHGIEHTAGALSDYIKTGRTLGFTRTNNARINLTTYAVYPTDAMNLMIDTVTDKSIEDIEKDKTIYMETPHFSIDELASVDLPAEKKKNVILKAINWIKQKTKEKFNIKGKQDQKITNSREDNDER